MSPPAERRMETISEDDIEKIADRAVEKAMERLYLEVGKSILQKFIWLVGVGTVAMYMWIQGRGN